MGLTTVTIGELKQMIRDVDAEGNGKIGFSEFVTLMARSTNSADAEAELKEVFSVFDKRGQKKIGVEDLKAVFLSLGEKLTDEEVCFLPRKNIIPAVHSCASSLLLKRRSD